ncbi:hypothetical protein KIN20_027467 [Parelaphostrongylus tenuis]|uniref:Uncharacterized protein n=1 Tax=Parelaphostrongylus tenuis TaxID=148309 RepID=A0AAD5QZB7_PARTN|nr:hypothetical protein KIN20_027467 [Parelaphostrongylus tenuis]
MQKRKRCKKAKRMQKVPFGRFELFRASHIRITTSTKCPQPTLAANTRLLIFAPILELHSSLVD